MPVDFNSPFRKSDVFAKCARMGEAAVLADLERSGGEFTLGEQSLAWEWIYQQRINREEATRKALRNTAIWTSAVAVFTALVALFTYLGN
jgi:hypothetical protein